MDDQLKSDFPIDWERDATVSRREFFKFMTAASGGLVLGSVGLAVWATARRPRTGFAAKKIVHVESIGPGTSIGFAYPGERDLCLLIRHADGSFTAFTRRCTHLSCPVDYEPDRDRLYCPCHNGAFSARDGRVLQGPPPQALLRVLIEERDGAIWAVGLDERKSDG
ncbi:MAG TPA: Rieske 2Fe-2S domain-containing protein [Fimbriimonadaceae bacterium]|nr:Rieske 2Fe-2S domain-containing protein [Fimbriimonadaceae bacterium]HRJ95855.1 Rieske 2Fe-2S domain-containing protein [Fimbriimonadaceae bacterium]